MCRDSGEIDILVGIQYTSVELLDIPGSSSATNNDVFWQLRENFSW
jgi:hypothetical protein